MIEQAGLAQHDRFTMAAADAGRSGRAKAPAEVSMRSAFTMSVFLPTFLSTVPFSDVSELGTFFTKYPLPQTIEGPF